ncbi:MAG: hypothetical protein M3024_03700 [Candidatus Dormibacteraeota bacterium]|nr:hypothetical protein [Candidatus Dormibacteraeota bacterium]
MPFNLARVRVVLLEIPRQGKLAYCLLRDPRVPMRPKLALGAALGLILGPVDLPGWIPVVGELDMLALGVLAVRVFVEACPEEAVEEHRAELKAGQSQFDRDAGMLLRPLRARLTRLASRIQFAGPAPPPLPALVEV